MDNIEKDIAQGYADFADDEGSIEEVETEENIVTENSTSFSFEETTNFSEMSDINRKLRTYFDGKIVRKDLTKSIKRERMFRFMCLNFYWDSIAVLMTHLSSKKVWRM